MKVYVSVDMEGIGGILIPEQLRRGELFYQEGRRLLTAEVNAVVEGLRLGGADTIYVKDAHGTGVNLLVADLDPDVMLVQGGATMDKRFPGLDASFDAALLVGYHAMAGTEAAIRDHTFSSKAYTNMSLNGQDVGEIALDSLLFGLHGVPVVFVSGDDKTCKEARETLGADITTYETKQGLGRHYALMKAPQKVLQEIPSAVAESLKKPFPEPFQVPAPYELQIQYIATEIADRKAAEGVNSTRIDGYTLSHKEDDFTRLMLKAFN